MQAGLSPSYIAGSAPALTEVKFAESPLSGGSVLWEPQFGAVSLHREPQLTAVLLPLRSSAVLTAVK